MAQVKPFDWYQQEMPIAIPGMKADSTLDVIDSFAAESELNPADPVIRGTEDGTCTPLTDNTAYDKVIGVAIHTHKSYDGTGAYYEKNYCLPVMTFGDIYVQVQDDVSAGGTVAYYYGGEATGYYPSGAAIIGSKTAGYCEYTISTNAAATTDTITFESVTLTAGTDFTSGATAAETAAAVAIAFASNNTLAAIYSFTTNGAKILVTEKDAGGGNTPGAMTYTGTVVIATGVPVPSASTTDTANDLAGMTYLASGIAGDVVPVRIRK